MQKKSVRENCKAPESGQTIGRTIKEEAITLGRISYRLIDWASKLKLDSNQKKEFLGIVRDLGFFVSWMGEIESYDRGDRV